LPFDLGLASWWPALVALCSGTALGFVFGFIPGIGGRTALILLIPVATLFQPYEAAIFLFAMHSVINTSGSIPNIAFGIPSSPSDMATIIDGYPLAKKGQAGEALGASLSASAIGGVLGALAFLIAIPIARPLVTAFGPPELLVLAVIGVTAVATVSREGWLPGFVVAALGIIVASVGIDARTGDARFTFGLLELWDGVGLPGIVCGLFVVPEMLTLEGFDRDSKGKAVATTIRDVFRGMFVTFRYIDVTLRSTLYGIVIGLTPALGSSVSVWLSYGYAARTVKSDVPFGKGAVAGVIAPEAANNSKEGGAMIPTLFFGIPGSSSMAIMIGALTLAGVGVGPNMLGVDVGLSYALAAAVALSNIIVVPLFFLVIPSLVRMAALRREIIGPLAIALSVMAAMIHTPMLSTMIVIAASAVLGIWLKLANWPRAPFILGYVVGPLAERSWFHTVEIYGWSAFRRPLTLVLVVILIVWTIAAIRSRPAMRIAGSRPAAMSLAAALVVSLGAVAAYAETSIAGPAAVVPVATALAALVLSLVLFWLAVTAPDGRQAEGVPHAWVFAVFVVLMPFLGLVLASGVFLAVFLAVSRFPTRIVLLLPAVFVALEALVLSLIFDVLAQREVVGRIAWSFLGY
jgi:TctA family transporter